MADENHIHHHHSHHKDESEIFKEQQLKAIRRKKMAEKFLFAAGCFLAVLIVLIVAWIYTNE